MANNGYEVVLSGYIANQFVQNVFHVVGDEAMPQDPYVQAKAIADEWVGSPGLVELFTNALPVGYLASSLRVRRIFPTGGPTAIFLGSAFAQSAGQRSGEISSLQANPLIIWIGTTTPSKTGRQFLPGVSETDIAEMVLVAGLISDINDFAAAHIAGVTATGILYEGAIWRRPPTGQPPANGNMDPIEFSYVSPLIGTQRRRLRPL